jgi:hypothetical protein
MACEADTEATREPPEADPAGRAACTRFRKLAADAFGETTSENEVVSGLEEVGSLAADSTNPDIRENGARVSEQAKAASMISGQPNEAQDALADACNAAAFPLSQQTPNLGPALARLCRLAVRVGQIGEAGPPESPAPGGLRKSPSFRDWCQFLSTGAPQAWGPSQT